MATEGQFPKVDGDILFASEVNQFNNKGLILSDDAGPYTNNTVTQNLVVTHVIGAGEVDDNIDIIIDKQHVLNHRDGAIGARDYYIRIDIGETSSETTKRTFLNEIFSSSSIGVDVGLDETSIFNYSPTTDEKTNGFNIKIYLYIGNPESVISGALSKISRTFVRKI